MTKRALLLLLLAGALPAARKPLTVDTLWDWRTVSAPQISPDARAVIFIAGWADKMDDAFYSNIWIAAVDGSSQRPLTQGRYRDTSAIWSPDGTRIAYLSNRSGRVQIHVRWVDSAQDAQITRLQQAPSNIAWSPDGQWISYIARVPAKAEWSVPAPEKPAGARWAAPPVIVTRLRWRADGSGLIRPGYNHIFVVPATGGTPRQISSGDYNHGGTGRDSGAPSWTPDGEWVLASANRMPDAEYSLEGGEIYGFRVRDGAVRQLTNRKGPDTNPVASPDGRKIAYTGYDYKRQEYAVEHIYVMDADGANPKLLTGSLDRDAGRPQWSADSKSLYFTADDRGVTHLYSVTPDGTVKQITTAKERFGGYSAAEHFTMSQGQVAVVRSTPAEPPDVVTFAVERPEKVVRLTESNDSLLADRVVGSVEEVTYDSFDGRPIQAWIMKPPDFDATRKYPLILDIHGGPHAMYGVEFNHQMQMFAGRGYVVLYTNPRGSTGYGEQFGEIIHTKYPGDDYKDLMAGVDMMVAKSYIDPKRLAVTGGSGGGLLTAWIIGHTDRFAAAVSQYPVTNWITQVGTADSGYMHAASWMAAMPWENPQQYLEHSPIFFAKNFKTPTMVITGEADLRTPMAQSEELYFALKSRKVDSVLVRIPDEPHGIRGSHPSHRTAKVEHILGWIERYTR